MITEVYKGAPNTPELYVPQQNMLGAVEGARNNGTTKCYVDVATGVGKTYAVAHDMKKYLEEKPDTRFLYLCHKGQVLEQARDTISEVLDPEVSHGNFYKKQYEDEEQVTYATFQRMGGENEGDKNYKAFDPKEFDYIVIDEGHHGPAPTYTGVIEYFKPAFQIGLTATDERMDGKDISEVLGPKVFEYTLEEAIAESVLVKPDYRLFTEHEADLKDLLEDENMPPTLKEINDRLTRVQRDKNYQQAIVGEIQAAQAEHEDPRTVIYCPDIQYADEFSKLIPEGQSLHSGLSDEQQETRLKAFRNGEIPTLLVVDIFNEGIDVPEINTMVFLRGTESKAVFLQQLGRGLRTAEGKEKVIALDFAASWQRIMLIAELKEKVQTIYKERSLHLNTKNRFKNSRTKREYFDTNDMVPFDFNFSKDALDAVNIVEKIRKDKTDLKNKKDINKISRAEKWNNVEKVLQDMFSLGAYDPSDPNNLSNLPNQRITLEEEHRYARKIALGDKDAQQEYLMRRLRFIFTKAISEYEKQPESSILTVEDHFQNGLEALTKALDAYGTTQFKKQPYLSKHIAMRLWGGMQKPSKDIASIIRIPEHARQDIKDIRKQKEKYLADNKDVASLTDDKILELIGWQGWRNFEKLKYLQVWEEFIKNGIENLDDLTELKGEGTPDIIEEISVNEVPKSIIKLLRNLSPNERHVLDERYGLLGGELKSAEATARGAGMSAARVREIENSTLNRLAINREAISLLRPSLEPIEESDFLNQNLPPTQNKILIAKERLAQYNYSPNGDGGSVGVKALREFVRTWGNQTEPKIAENTAEHPAVVEFYREHERAKKIEKIWKQHKQRFDADQLQKKILFQRQKQEQENERLQRLEEREREATRRREQRIIEKAEQKKRSQRKVIENKITTAERHYDWLEQNLDPHELVAARGLYNKLIDDLRQELIEVDQIDHPTT